MNYKIIRFVALGILAFLVTTSTAQAASSPTLGNANSFAILSSTYTSTNPGTIINGDLGYTTPPGTNPTVNGNTYTATTPAGSTKYAEAGVDQNLALTALNSQACTYSFATGPVDLATDTTHGSLGVYTPGVYCVTGAASISGTLTLSGSGTYIFRATGTLNSTVNTTVSLINGASACDVWWTPAGATTLGANSVFIGTDIDAAGITTGSAVSWTGRALAFGGTVSTDLDTISVPACSTTTGTTPGTTIVATTGPTTSGNQTTVNSGNNSTATTPGLPNTGLSPLQDNNSLIEAILAIIVSTSLVYYAYEGFKKTRLTK